MIEEWRAVAGTNGRYEVSNIGRVRRNDGLLLKPSVPRNTREYPAVMLRHSGERHRVAVHRLVALAFIGLPPCAGAQVRHLDGNHMNHRLDNLAWGTSKQNAADRDQHGTTARGNRHGQYRTRRYDGIANPAAKLTEDDVRQIRRLAASKSQRAIADQFGVHQGVIWRVINKRTWAHVD